MATCDHMTPQVTTTYSHILADFGIETLQELVEKTSFPWLISNVTDNETGRPLAEGKITHIIEWWGRKIGLAS